jgi:ABC-type multidrug transport system fused ATPase/permease subunit
VDIDGVMETARRLSDTTPGELPTENKELLLRGALLFRPGSHKLAAIDDRLKAQILKARRLFREQLASRAPGAVALFDPDRYAASQSLLNNIVFGKVTSDLPQIQERITQRIVQLLIESDRLEAVVSLGMQFEVGSRGDRLSGGQRQKLSIARALLKRPRLLILDEATSALDNKSQARIQNLIANRLKGNTTVVSVVHRLDTLAGYDRIAVMKSGQILELGSYAELMTAGGLFHSLVKGNP